MASQEHSTCPVCNEQNARTYKGNTPSFCAFCRFPLSLLAGKYRLEKALSEGGFGIVYLAHHTQLDFDTERAVKVIKPEIFKLEEHMHKRFRREVQITAGLSQQNEHIVRIYDDFGEDPNLGHYYVMEFLKGSPLEDIMPVGKGLDERIVFKIFGEVCKAMAEAHASGIIHRDLKPDNIFLEKRRSDPYFVKVLDFGIAKPLQQDTGGAKLTQGIMGTPMYMSPEQCLCEPVTQRSDMYSMAIILYELLTGRNPYNIDLDKASRVAIKMIQSHVMNDPTPIQHWRPDLSPELARTIMKAMAKRPDERFESVEKFWLAMRAHAPVEWGLAPLFEHYPSLPSLPSVGNSEEHFSNAETGIMDPLSTNPLRKAPLRIGIPTSEPENSVPAAVAISAATPGSDTPQATAETSATPTSKAPLIGLSVTIIILLGVLIWFLMSKSSTPTTPIARAIKSQTQLDSGSKAPPKTTKKTVVPRRKIPQRPAKTAVVARKQPQRARAKPPRRIAKKRRVYKQPIRRKPKHRCGNTPKGMRWVLSTLQKPKKGKPKLSFPGCRTCRVVKRGNTHCLLVPKRASTKVRIVMEGHLSCRYNITAKHRHIGWYLKYESLNSIANEDYNCLKVIK